MKSIKFFALATLMLLLNARTFAQTEDPWSDEAIKRNADAMLQEVMQGVQQTYDQAYQENMAAADKIIAEAELYRQQLENELILNYQNTIELVYNQVMAELDSTCNPEKLYEEIYKEIMASATEAYLTAYANGIANPAAYANQSVSALNGYSQSSAFSHNLVQSIQMRYPTGDQSFWVKRY